MKMNPTLRAKTLMEKKIGSHNEDIEIKTKESEKASQEVTLEMKGERGFGQ